MKNLLFEERIIALHPQIKALSRFFTDNPKDRENLLRDTILIGLIQQDDFVEGTNLLAWLTNIMKNKFIMDNGNLEAKLSRLPSYTSRSNIG